jgi:hypothetical protein
MIRRWRRPRSPLSVLGDHRFRLELDADEQALVKRLLDQLRGLVSAADPDDARVRRLFPTAYHDDLEGELEYQRLMREELVASQLGSLDAVDEALDAQALDAHQLAAFMRSLNALRLVLGTLLDLDDDTDHALVQPHDPLFAEHQLYLWLSWMLEHVVEALHSGLAES